MAMVYGLVFRETTGFVAGVSIFLACIKDGLTLQLLGCPICLATSDISYLDFLTIDCIRFVSGGMCI